ncbi:MAG: type II toxin-antitoxin system RatA family toxin [Gammaproteobacteria bacterium]|nr:type II toxin-antitoxin system RatA family toxin [Gammaproteobacteria bacterium]MCP4474269.1 type II toxin-antitoxin system RatA family toxin [Gammaproteobacteria bacterium]
MTTKLHRAEKVPYSDQQMFALVNDIDHYPEFLPWCKNSEILEQKEGEMVARLEMETKGVRSSFITHNLLIPHQQITMKLVEGPFSQFSANWHFENVEENCCRVALDMKFQFSHKLISMLFKRLFHQAANTMVEAFCQRAEAIYGQP